MHGEPNIRILVSNYSSGHSQFRGKSVFIGIFSREWDFFENPQLYNFLILEVSFFNAYLADGKRPCEVIQPSNYRPVAQFNKSMGGGHGGPPPRHHHAQHHHHVSKSKPPKQSGNKPPQRGESVSSLFFFLWCYTKGDIQKPLWKYL